MSSDSPILIAGCGRSGTTYLKTVVDAHPEVFIPTESLFIGDYLRYGPDAPRRLVEGLFFREPQLRAWYDGPRFRIDDVAEAVRRVHVHAADAEGASVWGQKTPRFVRYMKEFNAAYPGCRWLLICRDPRAVVSSMLRSVRHTYSVGRACRRWVGDNRPVVEHWRQPGRADNVMVLRYEDLVCDFDEHLRRIWEFTGLSPLSPEQVFERGAVREYRGSGFSVRANTVRGGLRPDPKLLHGWKRKLTAGQVRCIERACSREMAILGYEPVSEADLGELPTRSFERASEVLSPLADLRVLAEYLVHWPYYPIHHTLRRRSLQLCSLAARLTGRRHARKGPIPSN